MTETTIIKRTGQAPLRIRGELVLETESSWNNAASHYSGTTGRRQKIKIYKLASGRYLVAIDNLTQWQGQHDTYEAAVFPAIVDCVTYIQQRVPVHIVDYIIWRLGEETLAIDVE